MDSKAGSAYPPLPTAPNMDQSHPPPPTYDQAVGVGASPGAYGAAAPAPHAQPHAMPAAPYPGYQSVPMQQSPYPVHLAPVIPVQHVQPVQSKCAAQHSRGAWNIDIAIPPSFNDPHSFLFLLHVPAIVVQNPVGPHASNVTCPSCHQQVKSRVRHDSNVRTHLMALLCCIL